MLLKPKFKKIILNLRDPDKVIRYIPTAKVVEYKGKPIVVVPHRTPEVQILGNMGIAVPEPIEHYYQWSGQYTPFAAQRDTARFLSRHSRAYCLNDLGTGKTLSALWAFDYLRLEGTARKLLIIAPLSTLERVWGDELFRHFTHLRYAVLHGSKDQRLKQLARDVDVYIINHDGLKVIKKELAAKLDIDTVVVDELSQVARNAGTDRWKALSEVLRGRVRVWGLTGTPTPNEPTDAWAQCRLLTPHTVPPFYSRFRDMTMHQVTQFKWVAKPGALDTVYQAMQPGIRYRRDDCVDLPPVMHESRSAPLTRDQRQAFDAMLADLHAEFKGEQITAVNEAIKLMKLVQIACGSAYTIDGTPVVLTPKHRLQVVEDLIEEAAAKVIVFVPFRNVIDVVASHLAQRYEIGVIHGGVAKGERDRVFQAFQKEAEPRVLVAQPAAMSHGLTLTAANVIVWYAPITSAETYEQACARITRPGQKHSQLIAHVSGTRLEEQMYARLKGKVDMQGLLLEMFRSSRK